MVNVTNDFSTIHIYIIQFSISFDALHFIIYLWSKQQKSNLHSLFLVRWSLLSKLFFVGKHLGQELQRYNKNICDIEYSSMISINIVNSKWLTVPITTHFFRLVNQWAYKPLLKLKVKVKYRKYFYGQIKREYSTQLNSNSGENKINTQNRQRTILGI